MMAAILSGHWKLFLIVAALWLDVTLGASAWGVCFDKVEGHRNSGCIHIALLCWCFPGDTWLFGGVAEFEDIFEWLFLTFIYHYISIIIHFCLVLVLAIYEHYYKCSLWLFLWLRDCLLWFCSCVIIN